MSTSRYSSRAHQRDTGRTSLFTTQQQQQGQQGQANDQAQQPYGQQYNQSSSAYGIDTPGSSSSLNRVLADDDYKRSSSPYSDHASSAGKRDFTASMMSQLESQNEEEYGIMSEKLGILKDLGLGLGDQIKKSQLGLNSFSEDMDNTRNRLRGTYNNMMIMAKKSGIPLKAWFTFFSIIFLLFFWVWLF